MTEEDEEFNRMEREATLRRKAVSAALKDHVEHMRANMTEYERGVIDGRQMQVQSSVDKAVNALSKREWIGLTDAEISCLWLQTSPYFNEDDFARAIEARLKELNT
jgi:hypothetical protein